MPKKFLVIGGVIVLFALMISTSKARREKATVREELAKHHRDALAAIAAVTTTDDLPKLDPVMQEISKQYLVPIGSSRFLAKTEKEEYLAGLKAVFDEAYVKSWSLTDSVTADEFVWHYVRAFCDALLSSPTSEREAVASGLVIYAQHLTMNMEKSGRTTPKKPGGFVGMQRDVNLFKEKLDYAGRLMSRSLDRLEK